MGLILWIIPIIGLICSRMINKTSLLHGISIVNAVVLLIAAGFLTGGVVLSGPISYGLLGGAFYIDALSIIILDITIVIGALASVYSIGYLNEELKEEKINPKKIKLYYTLMFSFLFTMILALTVRNIGILWVAIEATTLASAFLVGFNNDKHAIEAAWKYIIICSVGIAMALVGIIFLHLSSVDAIQAADALNWDVLFNKASDLDTSVLRLAFIFLVVGFGTKAGLAPMHTWLPDAHSQAPSPISALLSGVLLNSAMYAIIRTLAIVNKNMDGSSFTGRIMIGFGLLSIAAAAVFILTQKDYKRLLAYSSIEHMGIIALSLGVFTPLSVFAAILHMINHSFTKSMLFLSSGSILQKFGTREIGRVNGLLKVLPVSGAVFLIGLLAITGTPPFSIFASEVNVFLSIFRTGNFLLGAVFVLLLAFIFAGIAMTLFKIFLGEPDNQDIKTGETNIPGAVVLLLLVLLITVTGLYLPSGMNSLIVDAQRIIIGEV